MNYCTGQKVDIETQRRKFTREVLDIMDREDSGQTLYVNTRYVVMYGDNIPRLDRNKLIESHKMLNKAFSKTNIEEISKIPNNTLYPWKPLVGNANIQFLPLDPNNIVVEYMKTGSLSSSIPVEDAHQRDSHFVNGSLNIYLGRTSGSSNILGQAEFESNIVFADDRTIGSPHNPGSLENYNISKTVIHEVGHAFGLTHTFYDNACDGKSPFLDVPEQVNPNFNTILFKDSNNEWTCSGDNRDRDRNSGSTTSCLYIQTNKSSAPNEMGINYMDYGVDDVSIMFTKNQCTLMRGYLLSTNNKTIDLQILEEDEPLEPPVIVEVEEVPNDTNLTEFGDDEDGLSTLVIVLIVLGCIVFIVIMYVIYKYMRKKSNNTPHMEIESRS